MEPLKRKRTDLSREEKKEVVLLHRCNPSWTQQQLANEFNQKHVGKDLKRNTVSQILKDTMKIMQSSDDLKEVKRTKEAMYPELESALLAWFKQIRSRGGCLSDEMLTTKANQFRNAFLEQVGLDEIKLDKYKGFKVSNGWLDKFKRRHQIARVSMHGESGDASGVGVAHAMTKMPLLIACYAPEDVYNMDETGLFYHAQPNKTLAQGKVRGRKIQKDRITLALAINTTGTDKLKPVIIYKSLRPRCFGRWLPTDYVWWFANKTAWMTLQDKMFKGVETA